MAKGTSALYGGSGPDTLGESTRHPSPTTPRGLEHPVAWASAAPLSLAVSALRVVLACGRPSLKPPPSTRSEQLPPPTSCK
eukprot:5625973-Prymnesium_polylepis.1